MGGGSAVVLLVALLATGSGRGPWTALRGDTVGGVAGCTDLLRSTLRIDPPAADWSLTVGGAGPPVTVLSGGQDEQAIRRAAGAAGRTGDDVLRRGLDPGRPLTVPAGTIAPHGGDAVLGGPGADAGRLADPTVTAVRECLGDVAVAMLTAAAGGSVRAVGLRRDPGDAAAVVSVMCVGNAAPAAVASAVRSGVDAAGVPYARRFVDPLVEELGGPQSMPPSTVRLTARNAPDVPVSYLLGALAPRDLPGVS